MRKTGKIVFGAAALLVGFAAEAAEKAKPVKVPDFNVVLTGYVVKPSGKSHPIGESLSLKEGDMVLSGDIFWFNVARASEPIAIRAVDTDFTIPANTTLRLAARALGGDLASLPAEAITYCEDFRHNQGKALVQLATGGIASLGARLRSDTQTCVIDTDRDGKFDKAFINGAKKGEDRHTVEIAPVAYRDTMFDPVAGDTRLEVRFYDGGMLSGPNFQLNLRLNGSNASFAALHFFRLDGGPVVRARVPIAMGFSAKKVPMQLNFGSGAIEVTGYDKATKTGTASVVRDFSLNGFIIEPLPTYIYIYY